MSDPGAYTSIAGTGNTGTGGGATVTYTSPGFVAPRYVWDDPPTPADPPPTPTTQWLTADDLATHLDLPVTTQNTELLDEACLVAQAWVMTRLRPSYLIEPIRPDILLAVKYQAAKLYRRRQTPEGIAQMGDFGPMRVMGTDPDVEALLRAYKYDGFV